VLESCFIRRFCYMFGSLLLCVFVIVGIELEELGNILSFHQICDTPLPFRL
jgi:hypothetical protein